MSKGNRNKKKKKTETNKQSRTIPRRDFLKYVGAMAVYASLASISGSNETKKYPDRWSFLERDFLEPPNNFYGPNERWRQIPEKFVPLGPEVKHTEKNTPLNRMSKHYNKKIREVLKIKHPEWKQVDIYATDQEYGVPDKHPSNASALEHCLWAEEFLYDINPMIKKQNVEWQLIKPGDDFEKGFQGKGFLQFASYVLTRIYLTDEDSGDTMVVGFPKPDWGAGIGPYPESYFDYSRWYISASTNDNLLITPFSEIIPLTTLERTRKYFLDTGDFDRGLIAEESHSEAHAILAAEQAIEKFRIPNGEFFLDRFRTNMSKHDRYKHLQKAYTWMKNNGLANATELYLDSPAKFMKAIGADK